VGTRGADEEGSACSPISSEGNLRQMIVGGAKKRPEKKAGSRLTESLALPWWTGPSATKLHERGWGPFRVACRQAANGGFFFFFSRGVWGQQSAR